MAKQISIYGPHTQACELCQSTRGSLITKLPHDAQSDMAPLDLTIGVVVMQLKGVI